MCDTPPPTAAGILAAIAFDADGLAPAIAQQHDTGEVLMLAWMNRESVAETLATGRVCYFSRSRGRLWRKGETSGQVQHLRELRLDCDGDTLLLLVDQTGVACHTGRTKLFLPRRARRRNWSRSPPRWSRRRPCTRPDDTSVPGRRRAERRPDRSQAHGRAGAPAAGPALCRNRRRRDGGTWVGTPLAA